MKTLPIPEIRKRMHALADLHSIPELHELAEMTRRKKAARRAPAKRKALTPALADAIRDYAKAHPDAQYEDIARRFDTNIGRVSEAINMTKGI